MRDSQIIMKRLYATLLFLLSLFFSACSNYPYIVIYDTQPSGANVVCDDIIMGFSPLELEYSTDRIDKNGILHTPQCKGVFVSGYEVQFSSKYDTKKFPNQFPQGSVIDSKIRPQGKGYQQDMSFSLDYERNRMLEEQNMILQEQLDMQRMRFWFGR